MKINKVVIATFIVTVLISVCLCGCKSGNIKSSNIYVSSTITAGDENKITQDSENTSVVSENRTGTKANLSSKDDFQSSSDESYSFTITTSNDDNNKENNTSTSSPSGYIAGDW